MIQEIKTEKFEGLLVKVPEDMPFNDVATKADCVDNNQLFIAYSTESKVFNPEFVFELPHGQWKLIGNPFELSEEDCNSIVDVVWNGHNEQVFKDYINDNWRPNAKDSLGSLLHSLYVYKENPFIKPDINNEKYYPITYDNKDSLFMNDWDNYEETEERTGNWILLQLNIKL